MNELYSVAGKVAVISGAAGALGGSLARHFAAQGADVVALVHRPEQVEPTVSALKALGGNPIGYACNVMDTADVARIADEVVAKFGRVDILINVAGGNVPGATMRTGPRCSTSTSTARSIPATSSRRSLRSRATAAS